MACAFLRHISTLLWLGNQYAQSDNFKVNPPNGINIRGNFRVSNAEIASKLSSYGTRIIEVEPDKIEQVIIRDFPDIKTVKVGVSLPANLNVLVVERIPSIIWFVDATEKKQKPVKFG